MVPASSTTSVPVIWDFLFGRTGTYLADALGSLRGVLRLVVDDDGGDAAGGGRHDQDYGQDEPAGPPPLAGRWHRCEGEPR
jgi:hypothetical protein